MFDDLKIRNKLVLLVAGPIIIILLLAAFGARSRQDTAAKSREVERLTALARADSDVVDALQRESLSSTAYVGSDRASWKAEMATARAATDKAIADALSRQASLADTSASFRSASTLAADAADKLIYIRSAVDQGYRWDQVVTTYQALQSTFLEVNDTIANNLTDPQVASDLRTGAALAAFKSTIAQQGAVLVGASEQGSFSAEGSFDLLRTSTEKESSASAVLNSMADTDHKGEIRDALTSNDRTRLEEIRKVILEGTGEEPVGIEAKTISDHTLAVVGDLHDVESNLYGDVISRSNDIRSDAERAANLFLLAAALAILVAIAAAVLLGRRITRPLNHLTAAADRLSSEQMPRLVEWLRNPSEDEMAFELGSLQPIEVESNDEIGLLANSFNDVQRVAGEVAAEQAALLRKGIGEMFVNLARRNQALLDRQIDFIDELERAEEDPDQLENLYRLDHLATRMRRNAESLLVLAGAEPPRRRGRPAPLANVVRAALAEVEDFARIDLLSFDEILVASNVAADLAHLLSELMENATNFSPPETRVEVVGHRTKAEGYVISVTDHGIGMSNEQIAEANESLAKPPLVGLALSRSLGFIVVGRLAGRHGVTVRMMSSPSGGVTAVVSIPPPLITDTPGLSSTSEQAPSLAAPRQTGPTPDEPAVAATGNGNGPPPPLAFSPDQLGGGPVAPTRPAGSDEPTGPVARPVADMPVDSESGLPNRRSPATDAGLPARRTPAPAAEATARTDSPAAGDGAESTRAPAQLPEALLFAAPDETDNSDRARGTDDANDGAGQDGFESTPRLDGPPPAAPKLPPRSGPRATPKSKPAPVATPTGDSKPYFLEEAQPPRLFGRTDTPAAPVARAVPGTVAPPVAAPPAAVTPEPRPAQPVTTMSSGTAGSPTGGGAGSPGEITGAGLAKRKPRQAGGARAIPGADTERGVGATRRSPEEVRSLLSGFRAGQQRARTEDPAPAGPDDKDANE